ncbi:MAG: ankyrin repeat domain-containing protein [Candidatus Electrothrix sp. GW3-4]|uniref:ankyrin repeat domain-containing protein n=1 Tax=Candidatus Electrothrix sp. GW3-4 TaxID=3126740 RepID=UPI0030CAAA04
MNAQDVLSRYIEEFLPEFIDMSLNDVNQHGHTGDTPLHVACIRGDDEEFDVLLTAGAEVNSIGELNNLPLHYAVAQGHTKIVKKLLENGADKNYKNELGKSATDLAVLKGFDDIMLLLS